MENLNQNENELVITKTFNAPRKLIFETFTQPKHLAHWWGPKGFTLEVLTLDVKAGGKFHYKMTSKEGFEMFGVFHYIEIVSPSKLVFTNSFSDKDGNVIKAPFEGEWPLYIYNVWTLEESNGVTTLTLRGKPHQASSAEQATFKANFQSMNQGFGGTFDQLTEYLKTI